MSIQENNQNDESQVRKKTMMVLGLTFILPVMITLITVYILLADFSSNK